MASLIRRETGPFSSFRSCLKALAVMDSSSSSLSNLETASTVSRTIGWTVASTPSETRSATSSHGCVVVEVGDDTAFLVPLPGRLVQHGVGLYQVQECPEVSFKPDGYRSDHP